MPSANRAFDAKATLMDDSVIEHDPQYAGENSGVHVLPEASRSSGRTTCRAAAPAPSFQVCSTRIGARPGH